MSIIRALLVKEWYRYFFGATITFWLLITVANLISGFLRSNVTPNEVILNYLIELPSTFKLILPIGCLVASLFSINKLKERNELTAIFAAGYSRKKVVLDLLYASLFVALAQFVLGSYVSPFVKANRKKILGGSNYKFRNQSEKGLRASTIGTGKIWFKSNDYFFSFSAMDKKSNTITDLNYYQFDDEYKLEKKITSNNATYDENRGWVAKNGTVLSLLNNPEFPKQDVFSEKVLALKEKPSDFKGIEADITTLNIVALYIYVRKLNNAGINTDEYLIMLLDKISSSLICLVFTVLAALAIFNPNRRNSSFGKNMVIVFIFTIAYWLINNGMYQYGATSKLNPILASFSVPLLFIAFLGYIFYKNRTLN